MRKINQNKQSGYVTLISVLVAGALGLSVSIALLMFGISASKASDAQRKGAEAKSLANTCAEEALEQIRENASYSGSGGLSVGSGTCTYTVVNNGGEQRAITAEGSSAGAFRRVSVIIQSINPLITATSWQENP